MSAAGQKEGFGAALAPGLVPSSTSPKVGSPLPDFLPSAPAGAFEIDSEAARLRRMKTGVMTWARVCTEWTATTGQRYRPTFVTLTYRASASWEPRHISSYVDRLAKWAKARGCRVPYAWVLELTKAGVPHYHLICWVPKRFALPKPDKAGWWRHGMSRIESAIQSGAVAYMAKYVSKGGNAGDSEAMPLGCRISGRGGLPRDSQQAREARWWRLPAWLREALPLALGCLARRAAQVFKGAAVVGPGGRRISWVSEFGEPFESPWASLWCPITRRLSVWRVA